MTISPRIGIAVWLTVWAVCSAAFWTPLPDPVGWAALLVGGLFESFAYLHGIGNRGTP